MYITYILGNGFDKQMGLKTSYADFLKEYLVISKEDAEEIRIFKGDILSQHKTGLWSDAEIALGKYLGKFSDSDVDRFIRQKQHFEKSMRSYLIKQQEKCDYSKRDEINVGFSDFILNSYADVMNRKMERIISARVGNIEYNFITFNYTDVIYNILDCLPNGGIPIRERNGFVDYIGNVFSVHGALVNAPIMGVNDESQLDCSGGVSITQNIKWNMIKPIMNSASGYKWDIPAKRIIQNSDILCFYGLSFGETDKMWWKTVRAWLNNSDEHKIILFVRDKEVIDYHIIAEELVAENKYKTSFLTKIGFDESHAKYQQFLDQVFVIHNTKKLDMSHLICPNN